MKRVILCAVIAWALFQPFVQAQEKEPLASQVVFEWTAAGGVLGAFVGFAIWLTDPGNPNIKLSNQMAQGASIGIFVGGGYGIYMLKKTAIIPLQPLVQIKDPLDPTERVSSDPVAALDAGPATHSPNATAGGFNLPLFNLRF